MLLLGLGVAWRQCVSLGVLLGCWREVRTCSMHGGWVLPYVGAEPVVYDGLSIIVSIMFFIAMLCGLS